MNDRELKESRNKIEENTEAKYNINNEQVNQQVHTTLEDSKEIDTESISEESNEFHKIKENKLNFGKFITSIPKKTVEGTKNIISATQGIFSFGRVYWNPKSQMEYAINEAKRKGIDLNKELHESENENFKTTIQSNIASKLGEDFFEQIKNDSVKMATYNQIITQVGRMEDTSKINFSAFRPEYEPQKVRYIFEAQREGFDTSIYRHLSPEASKIILNAQRNGLTNNQLLELLQLEDRSMEFEMYKLLESNGKKLLNELQYDKDSNALFPQVMSLDDAIKSATKESKTYNENLNPQENNREDAR